MRRAVVIALLLATALALALALAGTWAYAVHPWPVRQTPTELVVEQGANARTLGRSLAGQGIDIPGPVFEIAARLRGDAHRLRAGSFEVQGPVTLRALLDLIIGGDFIQRQLRIVEGWNFRQVRQALAAQPELRQEMAGLADAQVMERIGAAEPHPEGLFFPDTYSFTPGSSDVDVLKRAYRRQKAVLDKAWGERQADLPLRTPYEALVLASIVEKETGRAADRPQVAAVFVNRLRRGMMLQSDPTTIYGLGERFDGDLRRSDLRADTPYNTYTRGGLPPTPIAMPGRAAIEAALDPPATRALYFVARGDGSSQFSETLDAHNQAVSRYQRGR